ncbi:MAG: tellurite resistance TerB family protein, partial [Bdellovibrionales bacterium]
MNTKNLLDQLLRSGSEMLSQKGSSASPYDKPKNDLTSIIADKGAPALVGGVLGLLLGSKSGRKMGGKVLTYGGLALLGTLAYKAYQNYQNESSNIKGQPQSKPLDQLPDAEAEAHCRALLVALIAASKADGHIDDRERQIIEKEMARLTHDPTARQWFDNEIKKP